MASPAKIKTIHTLKTRLGIAEADYRLALKAYGVTSSKDLSDADASDIIRTWGGFVAPEPTVAATKGSRGAQANSKRYDELATRGSEWASPKQLRMVESMWHDVSIATTVEQRALFLKKFLFNRFGIASLEMLLKKDVKKVVGVLTSMKKAGEKV